MLYEYMRKQMSRGLCWGKRRGTQRDWFLHRGNTSRRWALSTDNSHYLPKRACRIP